MKTTPLSRITATLTATLAATITATMTTTLTATLAISPATAQSACYMVNSSGQRISLGKLCGEPGTGSSATRPAAQPRVIRAPIKRRNGRTPVIEVTFNGTRTFDMIVDTGASGTLITKPMAEALQVKPTGTLQAEIADGSTVEFRQGRVKSISVQGAVIRDVEVAIADRMSIGLLGHDFFENYDVRILSNTVEFTRR